MERVNAIRVLIAGNYPIFRTALRKLLESEADFRVTGEVPLGREVVAHAKESGPDIVLLHFAIPGQSALESLRELSALPAPVRTVILATSIEKAEIIQALQYGAQGVVTKEARPEQLFEGLRSVMKGQLWIGQESISHLVHAVQGIVSAPKNSSTREHFGLTRRELEIVAVIVSGFSNRDIAEKLKLSEHTVKHHIANIFDKLGVSNRMEVALMAISHHLVGDL